ncbi:MAG TPA: hypothetical protein VGB70_01285 [Allosphingosinicella sp.]|jgi:hypothetical protein
MKTKFLVLFMIFFVFHGCDGSEVVYDKDPFSREAFNFDKMNGPAVISKSTEFAKQHGLDIGINSDQMSSGDFNILLSTNGFNIMASNVIKRDVIEISATSKGGATSEQIQALELYKRSIKSYLGRPVD